MSTGLGNVHKGVIDFSEYAKGLIGFNQGTTGNLLLARCEETYGQGMFDGGMGASIKKGV